MILEKPRKLIDLLIERTQLGRIEWKETLPDIFQVSFKDNSVQLHMIVDDRDETITYAVSLLNSEGETVDRFNDQDLDLDEYGRSPAGWTTKLGLLFGMARRRARGADKVLDEILNEIEDDIPF